MDHGSSFNLSLWKNDGRFSVHVLIVLIFLLTGGGAGYPESRRVLVETKANTLRCNFIFFWKVIVTQKPERNQSPTVVAQCSGE